MHWIKSQYDANMLFALQPNLETVMTNETNAKLMKQAGEKAKPPTIGRLTLSEVDAALFECEKSIKVCSDVVKSKLNSNSTIPSKVLHELSKTNANRGKLMMRRIALLIDVGDVVVMELLDKLMKVKPVKIS